MRGEGNSAEADRPSPAVAEEPAWGLLGGAEWPGGSGETMGVGMARVEGEIIIDRRWRRCSTSSQMSATNRATTRECLTPSRSQRPDRGGDAVPNGA